MNQKLWEKFDKLRASPFTGHEGLAEFFQKEESVLRQKTFPLGRSSSPVGSGAQKEQFMFPNGWSRFFAS